MNEARKKWMTRDVYLAEFTVLLSWPKCLGPIHVFNSQFFLFLMKLNPAYFIYKQFKSEIFREQSIAQLGHAPWMPSVSKQSKELVHGWVM